MVYIQTKFMCVSYNLTINDYGHGFSFLQAGNMFEEKQGYSEVVIKTSYLFAPSSQSWLSF